MPHGSQHVHYNKILSNVSVEFKSADMVAERIMPRFKVENETDLYYEFDKSSFAIPAAERADGAPENESTGGWIEKAYSVNFYGLRDKITKRMRQNADSGLDLEVSTTNRLTEQLRNVMEYKLLGKDGILRTAANNGGSANADLTGPTASPRTVITDAITAVQKACGVVPNVMVMNPEILRKITLTAEYRDEAKHVVDLRYSDLPTRLYDLEIVTAARLANLDSSFLPVAKGLTSSLKFIMDDDIWVGYVKEGAPGMRDITYGVTFFTEQYSRKWHDDEVETDWVATNDNYVQKVIAKECGYLITSPFTA